MSTLPLFDTSYYLQNNLDVARDGMDPLQHYRIFGWLEGRNPNPYFDNSYYLNKYPDVAASGGNPLEHYIQHGIFEGRTPARNGEDYQFFYYEIDEVWYESKYEDVFKAGMDPWLHFNVFGWKEGRDPNPFFDTSYYLEQNPKVVEENVNPLWHYAIFGSRQGLDPHRTFDTSYYVSENPTVAAEGIDPLYHYTRHGQFNGRSSFYETEDGINTVNVAGEPVRPTTYHGNIGFAGDNSDVYKIDFGERLSIDAKLINLTGNVDLYLMAGRSDPEVEVDRSRQGGPAEEDVHLLTHFDTWSEDWNFLFVVVESLPDQQTSYDLWIS